MGSFGELQECKKRSLRGPHSPKWIFLAGIPHSKNGFLGFPGVQNCCFGGPQSHRGPSMGDSELQKSGGIPVLQKLFSCGTPQQPKIGSLGDPALQSPHCNFTCLTLGREPLNSSFGDHTGSGAPPVLTKSFLLQAGAFAAFSTGFCCNWSAGLKELGDYPGKSHP